MAKPTTTDIDQLLGLRLKKCRQQMGLSAAALAEAIGTTQQQISRYENGQNKLSAAQLYLLASYLDIPVSWFFLDMPEDKIPPHELRESAPPAYLATDKGPHAGGNSGFAQHELAQLRLEDDTANLQVFWPRLNAGQRSALLRLLDSMLA